MINLKSNYFSLGHYDEAIILSSLAEFLCSLGLPLTEEAIALENNRAEFSTCCESKNCYCSYDEYDYDYDFDSYKDSVLEDKDDGVSSSDQSSE